MCKVITGIENARLSSLDSTCLIGLGTMPCFINLVLNYPSLTNLAENMQFLLTFEIEAKKSVDHRMNNTAYTIFE